MEYLSSDYLFDRAIQRCLDWQQDGLTDPIEISHATEVYRQDPDIIGDFMVSECVLGPAGAEVTISHKDFYVKYQDWYASNSVDPITSRIFFKEVGGKG